MKLTSKEVHAWTEYLFSVHHKRNSGFHSLKSFIEAFRESSPTGFEDNWDGVEAFHIIEELEHRYES